MIPGDPGNDTPARRIIFAMRDFNVSQRLYTRMVKYKEAKAGRNTKHVYHGIYSLRGGFCQFRWNIKEQRFDELGLGKRDITKGDHYSFNIIYTGYPMPEYKQNAIK